MAGLNRGYIHLEVGVEVEEKTEVVDKLSCYRHYQKHEYDKYTALEQLKNHKLPIPNRLNRG